MTTPPGPVDRRTFLAGATAAAALGLLGTASGGEVGTVSTATDGRGGREGVLAYLAGLGRDDGGFAWDDQPASHLTPTFAAIGCHRLLGAAVEEPARRAEFVRTHHPTAWKRLEQEHREFDFQQVQVLVWLGADAGAFAATVRGWTGPVEYLKQYEQHGDPVFRHQTRVFACWRLLGLPVAELPPAWAEYVLSRRRGNGSFNNTPAARGGDGHVLNTLWGLESLDVLGGADAPRTGPLRDATVAWIEGCRRADGFTWQPTPPFAGRADLAYTWAAVRSLDLLGTRPKDADGLIGAILACRNADGGFGDRPGWNSNAVATYYALDSLAALGALDRLDGPIPARPAAAIVVKPEWRVYSAQIEAHGQGSPADAVALAKGLAIHLWGAKNAAPGWIARAQALADEARVPVTFFAANEEYGTWIDVPGLGTYSHMSDLIAPADPAIGPSLAEAGVVDWPAFRERRLAPLTAGDGRLIWQFGENEELVRLLLDDSLDRGGYAAISTFHFGNPDFTNSEPFLKRYRGRLPFVALQDAHGGQPWWFADMTTGFRTLFVAAGRGYADFLDALTHGRTVAVRRDAVTGGRLRLHGGSPEVVRFVEERSASWRWWDNPAIARPLASVVVVRPGDPFEGPTPERGVAVRVRLAHANTTQGQPTDPLADLVGLTVDGAAASPRLVTTPGGRNRKLPGDAAHVHPLPEIGPGAHTVTATVRPVGGGPTVEVTTTFEV